MNNKFFSLKKIGAILLTLIMLVTSVDIPVTLADTPNISFEIILENETPHQGGGYDVLAGKIFNVKIKYSVGPDSTVTAYRGVSIEMPLPGVAGGNRVEYISASGNAYCSDVLYVPSAGPNGTVMFVVPQELDKGQAAECVISVRFPNMITPDEFLAAFQATLSGTIDGTTPISLDSNTVGVYNQAGDDWSVSKSVRNQPAASTDGFYYVSYLLSADLAEDADRYGRLELDNFQLKDTLPATPAGGGARIESITTITGTPLVEGTDYTVQRSGQEVTAFTITTAQKTQTSTNVPANSSRSSTYVVTLKYPITPYDIPSNLPVDDTTKTSLTNTAELTYSLTTVAGNVTDTDTANIKLGQREPDTGPKALEIRKYISIGGEEFLLDSTHTGTYDYDIARFSLFTDALCTVPAKDYSGSTIDDAYIKDVATNGEGKVIFGNLRYGTYYIKETHIPAGFGTVGSEIITKVYIDSVGNVFVNDKQTAETGGFVKIVNPSVSRNIVQFKKYGQNSGSGAMVTLAGATFTLTGRDGTTGTYTAISDANGLVRFHNIPDGKYTIAETALSADLLKEYTILPATYDIEVSGGIIFEPNLHQNPGDTTFSSIVNVSDKGKFKVTKVDKANSSTKLSGAEFDVYGPYATAVTAPNSGDVPYPALPKITIGASGEYTSPALPVGYYLLKETKAPLGYSLIEGYTRVQVSARSTTAFNIENEAQAQVRFEKQTVLTDAEGDPLYSVGLAGIGFNIYKTADMVNDTTPINPTQLITRSDATFLGFTDYFTLAPGTYWYQEFPNGLEDQIVELIARVQFIVAASETKTITLDNTTEYGQIEVIKVSSVNPATRLSGAVFEIFGLNAAGTQYDVKVDEITTGTAAGPYGLGVARSKLLPPGTYYIKEKTAPSGYFAQATNIDPGVSAVVTVNNITSKTIANDPAVNVPVTKTDSVTGSGINNVTFTLYKSATDAANGTNAYRTAVTNASGVATFAGIEPGTYFYKETSVSANYVPSDTVYSFTVNSSGTVVSGTSVTAITNDRYATVKVYKQGKAPNADGTWTAVTSPIQGAQFKLYPKISSGTTDTDGANDLTAADTAGTVKTQTSNASGQLSFTNVAPGTYWLYESVIPTGYTMPAGVSRYQVITVAAGENAGAGYTTTLYTETNEPANGRAKIKKTSSIDPNTFVAATFGLYEKTGPGTYSSTQAGTITTSATNGVGISTLVPAAAGGTVYGIRELSVTGDFVYDDGVYHDVTIYPGQTAELTSAITNVPKTFIKIVKTATWDGGSNADYIDAVIGAKFKIYINQTGNFTTDSAVPANYIGEYTTVVDPANPNRAIITSGALDPSLNYWVVETYVPAGYVLDSTPHAVLSSALTPGGTYELPLDNTPTTVRLRIIKYQTGTTIPLAGASFQVYYVVPSGGALYDTDGDGTAETRLLRADNVTITTDNNGICVSIPYADPTWDFWIRETVVPPNYDMVVEWTHVGTIPQGTVKDQIVYNDPVDIIPVPKYDADTSNPLLGAVAAVFTSSADAIAMNTWLSNPNNTVPATITQAFLDAHNIYTYSVSTAAGFQFQLTANTEYWILEIKAPVINGVTYQRDTIIQNVKTNATATGFVHPTTGNPVELVFRNYPLARIRIKKVGSAGGELYNLDGAVFDIYSADASYQYNPATDLVYSGLISGASGAGTGEAVTNFLPLGYYVMVERTPPPNHEPLNPNYININLTVGGDYTYYVTNPIVNYSQYGRFIVSKLGKTTNTDTTGTRIVATYDLYKETATAGVYEKYLYAKDADGLVDDPYQISTTTTDAYSLSILLPPGNYKLVEVNVTSGYQMLGEEKLFTIEANKITNAAGAQTAIPATPNPILFWNSRLGSLTINKKGLVPGGTNLNLAGVIFSLFSDMGCTTKVYDMPPTNSSGNSTLNDIVPGTYYLKETSIGTNSLFTISPTVTTVVIGIGQTLNLGTLNNNHTQGKIQIRKVDSANSTAGLAATFAIYASSANAAADTNRLGTIVTVAGTNGGLGMSGLLNPGTYYLREVVTPSGYAGETDASGNPVIYTATVVANTVTPLSANVPNDRLRTVSVVKKNSLTSAPIAGAVFKLYGSATDAANYLTSTPLQTSVTTPANGTITFTSILPNKDYWIVETTTPKGYVVDRTPVLFNIPLANTDNPYVVNITNVPQGKIALKKVANWLINGVPGQKNLAGVEFTIYKYDAGQPGGIGAATGLKITTDVDGYGALGTDEYLDAGTYILIETKPAPGFTIEDRDLIVTVTAGATNTTLVTSAIENTPSYGNFEVRKFKANGTESLTGAEFDLYIERPAGSGTYVLNNPAPGSSGFVVGETGVYVSGFIPTGNYKIIETVPPTGYSIALDANGNPKEYLFTVSSGATAQIDVKNDAQGKITLTKSTDALNYSTLLNGATFMLWLGNPLTDGVEIGAVTTGANNAGNGIAVWDDLDPGTYYLEETVAPPGYVLPDYTQLSDYIKVEVAAGTSSKVNYPATKTNTADMGKILIKKVNDQGAPMQGVIFQIEDDQGVVVAGNDNLITGADGRVVSTLLPIGTYTVVEIGTTDGFILDPRLTTLRKDVTIVALQDPASALNTAEVNVVGFVNVRAIDENQFPVTVTKTLVDPVYDASTGYHAPNSLLLEDLTAKFNISGYATGTNPIPYDSFSVTDSNIALYWRASGSSSLTQETVAANDYKVARVDVGKSYNSNATTDKIDAVIQYQTFSQKQSNSGWTTHTTVENLQNITAGGSIDVTLPDTAVSVRVVYSGMKEAFISEGIDVYITFLERPSDATKHEIVEVRNQAKINYQYTLYGADGTQTEKPKEYNTAIIPVTIPPVNIDTIPLSLAITKDKSQVVAGNDVVFTLTVQNHDATQVLHDPVVVFDLPPYTTLLNYDATDQFKELDIGHHTHMRIDDVNIGTAQNPVMIKRVTLVFSGETLDPGETFSIMYKAKVNLNKPDDVIQIDATGYLTTIDKLPASIEHPNGTRFYDYAGDQLVTLSPLDAFLNSPAVSSNTGIYEYIRETTSVSIVENTSISIVKSIKGPNDTDYISDPNHRATAYPNGNIDYRITVTNGSSETDRAVKKLRIVDILPFAGDTFNMRNQTTGALINRATEIPAAPVLGSVSVSAMQAAYPGATITIYYATKSWAGRTAGDAAQRVEMSMVYFDDTTSWSGWTTTKPSSGITAIGIDVVFADGQTLGSGESVSAYFNMTVPGFTADQAELYVGKLISNAAMAGALDATSNSTRVENDQVIARVEIPTGSIGDYVWYDENADGLQNGTPAEPNASGITVRLHTTEYSLAYPNGNALTVKTTTTDANGYYIFEDLNCNLPKSGKSETSTLYSDFVGEKFYVYTVEFVMPSNQYVPTKQYAKIATVAQPATDSNAYLTGMTDPVRLTASFSGTDIVGEDNMTIDCGLMRPSVIGDTVWLDRNRDGIQDFTPGSGEAGINGVKVSLYDVTSGTPVLHGTTYTANIADAEGVVKPGSYIFTNLPNGQYQVEFDISALVTPVGGYSLYGFTQTTETDPVESAIDSDAITATDAADQIRNTGIIEITQQGTIIPEVDCGLIQYSALGGYAFDDRDYDDMQSIFINLTGTNVKLYMADEFGQFDLTAAPLRSKTVDQNGRYLFDKLMEGTYKVYFDFPDGYKAVVPNVGTPTTDSNCVTIDVDFNGGFSEDIVLPYNTIDTTWDGGARLYSEIGDYVWFDGNKDGLQGMTETAIANLPVYLETRADAHSAWTYLAQTTTDLNGRYYFPDLASSQYIDTEYRVIFGFTSDEHITTKQVNGPGQDDDSDATPVFYRQTGYSGYPTDHIKPGYGLTDHSWDAGKIELVGAVGDFLWYDINRNGIQDDGEPGIPNTPVRLFRSRTGNVSNNNDWELVGTLTTTQSGYYRFDDLPVGTYRIEFFIPVGYSPSIKNVVDPANPDTFVVDSDASIHDTGRWYYSRAFLLEERNGQVDVDLTWDAGVVLGEPRTGDETDTTVWIITLGAALLGAIGCLIYINRRAIVRLFRMIKAR